MTIHTIECDGRTVHLIDTPGFNDTARPDGEILQELAFWLIMAHEQELQLNGIIYLHPITAPRLQGSGVKSLAITKKLIGEDNYPGVFVATTRWDEVPVDQINIASQREDELREKVSDVIERGGRLVPLSAGRVDAMRIISHIVNKREHDRMTLAFQRQIVEEGLAIDKTDAGKLVFDALDANHAELQRAMEESQSTIFKLIDSRRDEGLAEALEWQDQTRQALQPLEADMERMQKKMKEVQQSWEERLRTEADALAKALQTNEERLARKTEELTRLNSQFQPQPASGYLTPLRGSDQRARTPSPSSINSNSSRRSRSSIFDPEATETSLLREIGELGHEHDILEGWSRVRPDGRHTRPVGHNSAWSVVGTGLAVAQVVAAIACNVM